MENIAGRSNLDPLLHIEATNNTNTLSQDFFPTCKKIAIVFGKFVAGVALSAAGLGITFFVGAKIAGFALGGTIALLAVYSLAMLIATVSFRYLNNKNDKSWSTAFLKGSGFIGVIALAILCEALGGCACNTSPGEALTSAGNGNNGNYHSAPKPSSSTNTDPDRPTVVPVLIKSDESKLKIQIL